MGAHDIAGDLLAQFHRVAEFFLFAQALPKSNFNAFCFELFRRVEEVCFDGQGSAVESGTHADIGDGAATPGFAVEESPCDVNARGRKKFLFGLEVERRNGEAMADAFARNNLTSEDEWPCEKTASAADIAFGNFAPEQSAADDFAAVDDRRNDNHFETKALAQLLERRC